ncbi:MAG: exodeoxyribonuclease V subunit gamma, partial [Rubrivivax sp.]
ACGAPVWLQLSARKLVNDRNTPIAERLIELWLRSLLAGTCGRALPCHVVSLGATLHIEPMPIDAAEATLNTVLQAWHEGMDSPLPLACATALALLAGASDVAATYEGGFNRRGEVEDMALARLFPDFEALTADGRFPALAERVYGPLLRWSRDNVSVQRHEAA